MKDEFPLERNCCGDGFFLHLDIHVEQASENLKNEVFQDLNEIKNEKCHV